MLHGQELQRQALWLARSQRVAAACVFVLAAYLTFVKGMLPKLTFLDFCVSLAALACGTACVWAATSLDDVCSSSLVPDLADKSADERTSWPPEDPAARKQAERWWCGLTALQAACVLAQLGTALYFFIYQPLEPADKGAHQHVSTALYMYLGGLIVVAVAQGVALCVRCCIGLPLSAANVRFLLAAKSEFLAIDWSAGQLWPSWARRLQPQVFCFKGIQQDLQHNLTLHVVQERWKAFVRAIPANDSSNAAFAAALEKPELRQAALQAFVCSPKSWRAGPWLGQLLKAGLLDSIDRVQVHMSCEALHQTLQSELTAIKSLSDKELKKLVQQLCKCCEQFVDSGYPSPALFRALTALLDPEQYGVLAPVELVKILVLLISKNRDRDTESGLKYMRQVIWGAALIWRLYPDALSAEQWRTQAQAMSSALSRFKSMGAGSSKWRCIVGSKSYYVYSEDHAAFASALGHLLAPGS